MKYLKKLIAGVSYQLIDLDQKEVERRIIADIDAGVDVYYDQRWEVTDLLTTWLEQHREIYAGKRVLVLGAGVGAETLVLGRLCNTLFINDLSPVALELCGEQLRQNGVDDFGVLLGNYERLELPEVDLIVASFLVYNKETLRAMRTFVKEKNCQFLLMNGNLPDYTKFLKETHHEVAFETVGAVCVIM